MSINYNQYLGARKCCDIKVQGPQGPQGAQGPSSIGPMGYQGSTGTQGYQGATGRSCVGPTGAQGPPGESQWVESNVEYLGQGYTGIGYTGDVIISGALRVSGGIDPIYLALTPQSSGPQGFTNPLWVDTVYGNALRSNNIYMNNQDINNAYVSLKPDNNYAQIILSDGSLNDIRNSMTYAHIIMKDPTNNFISNLTNNTLSISDTSSGDPYSTTITPNNITFLDNDGDNRYGYLTGNDFYLYDETNGANGEMRLTSSSLKINLINAPENFIRVTNYGIQYPTTYNNTDQSLSQTSNYSQIFNGTTLTGTLALVDASNVGIQFLITNTNGGSLIITSTGGQLIYSSTGAASATSRTLAAGHSHIFTAIITTGATTYGWSMV